jgi:hypothetical protein
MGDPYFHHPLTALGHQESEARAGLVDLGSPFHSEASTDPLFETRRAGRGRRNNIPVLSGGRAVRRAQGAPSITALAVFAMVAAGIAAYAASRLDRSGPAPVSLAANPVLQQADFPVGSVFLARSR